MTSTGLTAKQLAILAVTGAALWFLAAMILRIVGPLGAYEGWGRVILYVLVIPGTVPFIPISRKLAGLRVDQTAIGIAAVTTSALLLDGIALAVIPTLYGSDVVYHAGAGAAILWGAGVGQVLGFLMTKAA